MALDECSDASLDQLQDDTLHALVHSGPEQDALLALAWALIEERPSAGGASGDD